MPTNTFFNLHEDKQNLIISAAIEEFSSANYSEASINQICKKSNIAKGSFYQYFTDKLDLYQFIMALAIESKIEFFSNALKLFHSLTLQEQIRLLFIKGIEFAKAYPKYASLGEQFSKEKDEEAKAAVIKVGQKQSDSIFIQMIEHAKSKGEVKCNVDTTALSMILQALNTTINEYMSEKFNDTNYERYEEDVNKLVDSLLYIIFNGIND